MDLKIRQLVPACLFGARLWNPSGSEMAIRNWNAIGAIETASPEPPMAGNLGFPQALLAGRKGRKVQ